MTYLEALEIVIARTKHERYRWLCSDENLDAPQREGYRRQVLMLAGEPHQEPQKHIPLAVLFAPSPEDLLVRFRGLRFCLYGEPIKSSCCTHAGTTCHWLKRSVMAGDCLECLSKFTHPSTSGQ